MLVVSLMSLNVSPILIIFLCKRGLFMMLWCWLISESVSICCCFPELYLLMFKIFQREFLNMLLLSREYAAAIQSCICLCLRSLRESLNMLLLSRVLYVYVQDLSESLSICCCYPELYLLMFKIFQRVSQYAAAIQSCICLCLGSFRESLNMLLLFRVVNACD